MVLNMPPDDGRLLLELVDSEAQRLLAELPTLDPHSRAVAQKRLQRLGVLKHRLHYGLDLPAFSGPGAWGLPLRPR